MSSQSDTILNVAPRGRAMQSSFSEWSHNDEEASYALTGYAPKGYAFHTGSHSKEWWCVDLGQLYSLHSIKMHNREGFNKRYENVKVRVSISSDLENWTKMGELKFTDKVLPATLSLRNTPGRLKERGLEEYTLASSARIGDYEYIIAYTLLKVTKKPGQKLICFPHAVDNMGIQSQSRADAIMLPFETAMLEEPLVLVGNEYELLRDIPSIRKGEICYTGPFHIEPPEITDKSILKSKISELYKISVPDDKPLIFVVDGENVHFSHVIHAINYLSQFAKIIYKPVYGMPEKLKRKINPEITVLYGGYANNLIRYASDFIMCEYFSGTCMSSLMKSLPVIPYYSRTIKHKAATKAAIKPVHYLSYVAWHGGALWRRFFNSDPKGALITYLHKNNLLFDIMDTGRLGSMIEDKSALKNLYSPHMDNLQSRIFGNYMREGSPEKTAQLIMRFTESGTFGEDCAAVFIEQ